MRCAALVICLCSVVIASGAGPYQVKGFFSTLTDPFQGPLHFVRVSVHYPVTSSPMQQFPLLVFSPGYLGAYTYYDWVWQYFVPRGYVVAIGGSYDYDPISDPTEKGRDQAFLLDYLRNESISNPNSPVYHLINPSSSAAMGHSEGGVASIISADPTILEYPYHNNWTTLVVLSGCFPPWELIYADAAKYDTLPILWITGTHDCICTPSMNSYLYGLSPSTCKYFTNLVNASHCLWSNMSVVELEGCWAAEVVAGCGLDELLSLSVQISRSIEYIAPWLNWKLKGVTADQTRLNNQLSQDKANGIVQYEYSCSNSALA